MGIASRVGGALLDGKPVGTGIQNLIGMPGALLDAIQAGDHRLKAACIGLLTILTTVGILSVLALEGASARVLCVNDTGH